MAIRFGRSLDSEYSIPVCLQCRVPSVIVTCRCRNINLLSIDYALRPRLRSRLTRGGLNILGNLGFTANRILTCFIATHVSILTRSHSTFPYSYASAHRRRSPTTAVSRRIPTIRGFGTGFNRQSFSAQNRSMSQLLRYV